MEEGALEGAALGVAVTVAAVVVAVRGTRAAHAEPQQRQDAGARSSPARLLEGRTVPLAVVVVVVVELEELAGGWQDAGAAGVLGLEARKAVLLQWQRRQALALVVAVAATVRATASGLQGQSARLKW